TFGLEIAISAGASVVGGVVAVLLEILLQPVAPNRAYLTTILFLLPIVLIRLALNGWRLRWARNRLNTRFRLAAAGTDA
ncbi:MAG TPA: hypothetical protein VMB21_16490, partial [Candidatus Limnocylindria bacterium]|nr:hypothetical protein [Candidatus Limnocylindria bacterium]